MRILIVNDLPLDEGYGAEVYVRRLVAGLRAAGDDVEVMAGEITHRGARRALDLWDPAARRRVENRVRRCRPDVVHFHNVLREMSPSVLGAGRDVPAVMTVHDLRLLGASEHRLMSVKGAGERIAATIARSQARHGLAATIAVSQPVAEALVRQRFPAVTVVPVPLPARTDGWQPMAGTKDVAVVARLEPDKGVDVAIDAFGAAVSEHPDARLLIAGDGSQRDALQRRAEPLAGRVRFLGRLDETGVAELLDHVRVVVVASMPSRRPEGSSLTAVEALAHGRPVVASDDAALRTLAADLDGIVVVPAGDAPATAEALCRLLADDDAATRLGEAGRAAVLRRHSLSAVVAATQQVYRNVLEAGA